MKHKNALSGFFHRWRKGEISKGTYSIRLSSQHASMKGKMVTEPGPMLLGWAISAGLNGMIETPDYLSVDLRAEDISQTVSLPK